VKGRKRKQPNQKKGGLPKVKQKTLTFILLFLFFAIPILTLFFAHADGFRLDQLKAFDLNGMLKEINAKTKTLGSLNKTIYAGLNRLDQQSGKTKTVSQKLSEANQGVKKQEETLENIRQVTQQQVTLAHNLHALSELLTQQMSLISKSGQIQVNQSDQLKSVTFGTRTQLSEVLKQNQIMEQKLGKAAEQSERVDRSVP
jgi:hypothetical protein